MEADELLPLGEVLQTLRLGDLAEGDLLLTDIGKQFAQADTDARKTIFGAALRAHVPLANAIRRTLDERWNHRAAAVRFRDELEDHMSPDYADETLRAVIGWGRYAELFSYDEEADQFSLEDIDTAE
jgi:NitT/TauT family transport system ATP-binding protein